MNFCLLFCGISFFFTFACANDALGSGLTLSRYNNTALGGGALDTAVVTSLENMKAGALGVVEGFYWAPADAVRGQSGQYSHVQRQDLLVFMGSQEAQGRRLNTYLHAPQTTDTMALWDAAELAAWTATSKVARAQGVKLVLALRPGFIKVMATIQQAVDERITQILQAGVADIILAWDDAAGAGTLEQLERQRNLVNDTVAHGAINVWGVVPPAYYGDADVQVPNNDTASWSNKLAISQRMPIHVRFLLAGQDINPSSFNISSWPSLGARELVFWDNDAAVDTSKRLPWGLPSHRDPLLFSEERYVLNLAFPPERVIHEVAAILLPEGNATTTASNIRVVSEAWSSYLVQCGLVTTSAQAQVRHDLSTAITTDQRFDSIAALVAAYPSFEGVWDSSHRRA
jgi:hypothetical protein